MKIYSVYDPEFALYGKVLQGYDISELLSVLNSVTPLPEGVEYVPSQPELEALPIAKLIEANAYGGMPVQLGWCNGHNTKLNCLEYHRDSELNLGTGDFILLVANEGDIKGGMLDTGRVRAFRAPAGTLVEVYATTLHYAPCCTKKGEGFKVMVVLPRGTNGPKPDITPLPGSCEDTLLWAKNKWLLAHRDSTEASQGAAVALTGENIDISQYI